MSNNSNNNKRIAKNTLLLYIRMLLTMGVSLYTSRIILNVLGVEDFGIYNVVGGVVAIFSIISGSLSSAISRFITIELGHNNIDKLKKTFSASITIQLVLALIIGILAEIGGVWFLNNQMNIPTDRLPAANWVLQCSILTFIVNLISVPYNAAIIAHERMKAFAYVSLLEVTLKLLIALLLYISHFDKLMTYSILIFIVAILIRFVYGCYCRRHFEECTYKYVYDKSLLKEIASFAGWNYIGVTSSVLRDQGINILINIFCGPAVNAARGISLQVNAAVQGFVNNFMTALNPQITKSYAINDNEYMFTLIFQGARLSYYMLLLLSLPIIIETDNILLWWLKTVPQYAISFVRLVLIFAMLESLSGPLITAMLATGRIRNYQIIVGGIQILNFPISYIFLKSGFTPETTVIISIILSQCCLAARLLLLHKMIGLSIGKYLNNVYINTLTVSVISAIIPIFIYTQMEASVFRCLCTSLSSLLCTAITIYTIGCNQKERYFILQKIHLHKNKF